MVISGPPFSGKTVISQRLADVFQEAQVYQIYTVIHTKCAGLLFNFNWLSYNFYNFFIIFIMSELHATLVKLLTVP